MTESSFVQRCNKLLKDVQWTDAQATKKGLRDFLTEQDFERKRLADEIERVVGQFSDYADVCYETPTHYKWLLYRHEAEHVSLWLHEFKQKTQVLPEYSNIPHNHRYQCGSLILIGGYKHTIYDISRSAETPEMCTGVSVRERSSLRQGAIYTLDEDTMHSVAEVEQPTVSLFVRGPAKRGYSESLVLKDLVFQRHYPFSSRAADLRAIGALVSGTTTTRA